MPKVNFFDHVHIYAADPEATAAFYRERFEASVSGEMAGAEGGTLQLLRLGGQTLVVGPFPPGLSAKDAPPGEQRGGV